jgi:hypothetical protein
MRTTTRSGLAVVAAGVATALVAWAVIRLLGVDLTLKEGAAMSQVGAVDVLLASLVAGLAAWGVYAPLAPGPMVAVHRQHGPRHLHHRPELPGRRHLRRLPDLPARPGRGGADHGVHGGRAATVPPGRPGRRLPAVPWLR